MQTLEQLWRGLVHCQDLNCTYNLWDAERHLALSLEREENKTTRKYFDLSASVPCNYSDGRWSPQRNSAHNEFKTQTLDLLQLLDHAAFRLQGSSSSAVSHGPDN